MIKRQVKHGRVRVNGHEYQPQHREVEDGQTIRFSQGNDSTFIVELDKTGLQQIDFWLLKVCRQVG